MKPDAAEFSYLPTNEFLLTFVDERPLARRLLEASIVAVDDLKGAFNEFRDDPHKFVSTRVVQVRRQLFQRDRGIGFAIAVLSLIVIATSISLIDRRPPKVFAPNEVDTPDVQIFSIARPSESPDKGFGKNGNGRVGLNRDRGEGSNLKPQKSGGGGSGGNRDRLPQQVGKLPVPSSIPAPIPKTPPLNPPALPAAGINLDPALWRDLKLPQYGDPLSKSNALSNGPGVGGGMGIRRGTGVGDGDGDGFGPGKNGNTGGDENQRGCCGPGASSGSSLEGWENRIFRGNEVEQRARLLAKPEPQYTEEARRNQITGTVVLRVVFASNGEVTQIRAVQPLPFGLTERAIVAARQIKFIPALKGGHSVSVQMQLEYNFNLY